MMASKNKYVAVFNTGTEVINALETLSRIFAAFDMYTECIEDDFRGFIKFSISRDTPGVVHCLTERPLVQWEVPYRKFKKEKFHEAFHIDIYN
jgi:hypothetical protein